jgi:hypothetical protein
MRTQRTGNENGKNREPECIDTIEYWIWLHMMIVRVSSLFFNNPHVQRQLCIVNRGYAIVTEQQWIRMEWISFVEHPLNRWCACFICSSNCQLDGTSWLVLKWKHFKVMKRFLLPILGEEYLELWLYFDRKVILDWKDSMVHQWNSTQKDNQVVFLMKVYLFGSPGKIIRISCLSNK